MVHKYYIISKTLIGVLLFSIFFTGCKKKVNNNTISESPINQNKIPVFPCEEVELIGKDPMKSKIMKETINFFLGNHCFTNNRGIVRLYVSADRESNEVWTMYSDIEDRHMRTSSVSNLFEVFNGDIVLIYGIDYENENNKLTEEEKQNTRMCIDQVIGNRVYQRPTRKDRWSNEFFIEQESGDTIRLGQSRASTGTSCKRRVVFHDDGSYEVISQDLYY